MSSNNTREKPRAIETLQKILYKRNVTKNISVRILEDPPVMGAVIWALEIYGVENAFNKVRNNFILKHFGFGKGFKATNLKYMIPFYVTFSIHRLSLYCFGVIPSYSLKVLLKYE